jgi:hypothetical protein
MSTIVNLSISRHELDNLMLAANALISTDKRDDCFIDLDKQLLKKTYNAITSGDEPTSSVVIIEEVD